MTQSIIIIGAGPSGLFTAIHAAGKNNKVVILEKNSEPGKKLLMSGSGQCNLTHSGEVEDLLNHYGEAERFLLGPLYSFNNGDLLDFFRQRGLEFITTSEGKVFPATFEARDILNILLKEIKRLNVKIKYNTPVKDINLIEKDNNFLIESANNQYQADLVVLATGGNSYQATGSSGDGYKLAAGFGHKIIEPKPALVAISIKNYQFKELAGISLDKVMISLWRENKLVRRWQGDLLFTHQGLSGPGILNNSRYIEPGDLIKLRLVDLKDEARLDQKLIDLIDRKGESLFKNLIKYFKIPERLGLKLLRLAGIPKDRQAAQLSRAERKSFGELLYELPLKVERRGSFNEAMVTAGGISLDEINSGTMESELRPGLFAVGELLNIDGDTGGYNLQFAFSSGFLAGQEINTRTKQS
ncbi:MAG: NAD(P)/FAD-dependent oxidoreductase [Halarsenatibacteraceae bacterium]